MKKSGQILVMVAVTVILLNCFMLVECASPSPIPKPHPPQFNIYLVNHPYDVPPTFPTYTTDPYTGEQKMVNNGSAGYHVDNVTIELWIQNQQQSYSNGTTTYTPYFDVRVKGHFEQDWNELYPKSEPSVHNVASFLPENTPAQSNAQYTVISYSSTATPYYPYTIYPENSQVDFQVATVMGHYSQKFISDHMWPADYIGHYEPEIAYETMSDWSETQSIIISNNTILASTMENPIKPTATPISIPTDKPPAPTPTPTPTSTPTPTPTIHPPTNRPSFNLSLDAQVVISSVIAISALIVAVISLIYMKHRRRSNCFI
jgi:hypothetical protein